LNFESSWGAGNSGATNRLWLSSSLNTCKGVIVTITDRMAAWRRERRVLRRVSRAAWRLEQAERERAWALASARVEGVSIRTLAAAAGLSPARVHQITAGADRVEYPALCRNAAIAVELCQRAVEMTGRVLPGSYRPGSRASSVRRRPRSG
jgi:hypothetical protein